MNWSSDKVISRNSHISGNGTFALDDISQGELVIVFGGHVITIEQAFNMPQWLQNFPHHISDNLLLGPINKEEIDDIDYVNHSCAPNVGFRGPIELVAMQDIAAGEELTFDYATCMTSTIVDMDCNCGARNCRKVIRSTDWKLPELQKKYKGYFQPYIERKIAEL